jgi:hypothetical protein
VSGACNAILCLNTTFQGTVQSELSLFFQQCCVSGRRRSGWALMIFFPLVSLFSLSKYKSVLLFVFCIQICHYFNCYMFFLYRFFSSILLLIIWFHLIFMSNLVSFFLLFFLFSFSNWFFFQLNSSTFDFKLFLYQI